MFFGELRDKTLDYQCGHDKGISRAFHEARESICKIMYKKKKKKLNMYEICDILRIIEHDYLFFCHSYGMGSGYDFDDDFEDPES